MDRGWARHSSLPRLHHRTTRFASSCGLVTLYNRRRATSTLYARTVSFAVCTQSWRQVGLFGGHIMRRRRHSSSAMILISSPNYTYTLTFFIERRVAQPTAESSLPCSIIRVWLIATISFKVFINAIARSVLCLIPNPSLVYMSPYICGHDAAKCVGFRPSHFKFNILYPSVIQMDEPRRRTYKTSLCNGATARRIHARATTSRVSMNY